MSLLSNANVYVDDDMFDVARVVQSARDVAELKAYFQSHIKDPLASIRHRQQNLPVPQVAQVDKDMASTIGTAQAQTKRCVDHVAVQLTRLLNECVLAPSDVQEVLNVQNELQMELRQLELYKSELEALKRGDNAQPQCYAALVIVKQPFPKAVKKGAKVAGSGEDSAVVRMLTGAQAAVVPTGKMRAELCYEDYHERDADVQVVDSQPMDDSAYASFYNLKFTRGTRLKAAHLRFVVDVRYEQGRGAAFGTTSIQSEPSAPFIILTNESQWESSEGTLLADDAFSGDTEVPIARFFNFLQVHTLRAIRQSPLAPARCLALRDVQYLTATRFGKRRTLSRADFDTFWKWFGKVVRKVRHQQPFGTIWLKGYVLGFISREQAEAIVKEEAPGTFLLRFSERVPGKIVITSVRHDAEQQRLAPHHFLVAPRKNESPNRLLDIIESDANYQRAVVLHTDFLPQNNTYIKHCAPKDDLFREFYTKREQTGDLAAFYTISN
jgi:EF-hand fold domain/STATa Immunoglobulin-like domain/SH2 domain/Dictyostelium STAT, coiled coil